jgi:hypothetical protein
MSDLSEAAMKQRTVTPREEAVIKHLYAERKNLPPAFVTTAAPIPMGSKDDKGPWGPNPDRIIPAGTTLKIVMVSRMGDCGLIDDLEATHGYAVRFNWESAALTDFRLTKEPTP